MLGRPYAIADAVIDIHVPSKLSGDSFSHLVRIGRITSDMHVSISYPEAKCVDLLDDAKNIDSSSLLSALRSFHRKLRLWRLQVPVFEHQTCVYETPEFFELTFQESRLWLFRAAINNLPTGFSYVRDKLLLLCLHAARQVIGCFNNLWQRGLAVCSRSSTRLILISGLITVSVFKLQMSQRPRPREDDDVSDVDINFWLEDLGLDSFARFPTVSAFRETIETAGRILSGLAIQMPDVVAYAQFFEVLEGEVEKFHQVSSSAGAREVAADNLTHNNGAVSDPTLMVSAPGSSQPHQYYSHEPAQQNGGLDVLSLGLHEQQATGGTALDNLLSNMYQGDHISNNDDGVSFGNDAFWSFPHAPWMEEIDGDISGFIWDAVMPWQGSPFANT
jgi:hypothetical protein